MTAALCRTPFEFDVTPELNRQFLFALEISDRRYWLEGMARGPEAVTQAFGSAQSSINRRLPELVEKGWR